MVIGTIVKTMAIVRIGEKPVTRNILYLYSTRFSVMAHPGQSKPIAWTVKNERKSKSNILIMLVQFIQIMFISYDLGVNIFNPVFY